MPEDIGDTLSKANMFYMIFSLSASSLGLGFLCVRHRENVAIIVLGEPSGLSELRMLSIAQGIYTDGYTK